MHDRTVEELRADLEVHQANLEMIMQTNPGVIEQYERRQADVCPSPFVILRRVLSVAQIAKLTKTLNDREKNSQRLEREIKSARVRKVFMHLAKRGFDKLNRTIGNLPSKGSWKVLERSFPLPLIVSWDARVIIPHLTE